MKRNASKKHIKKPIYKKWWFWVLIIIILIAIIGNSGNKDTDNDTTDISTNVSEQQSEDSQNTNSALDEISFSVSDVRNDVTGNWRISTIADNIDMVDYAIEYYNKYFESDDEIHAIVNFNYNTTTKISVIGNLLDVSVYEYVDKEEHDAKLLFSGMLLKEYHINKDTGEIEEIQ